ncbi:hypothetical protein AXG93_2924s1000 [Marchantia polymorpha subsp. ruderalis]|uniref:Uncharacterized protein n=1 Tax=Marchantia polymorpha subsp. ruderalis TaxID=1480154 RepID=A0A176VU55_MARPO|nr:hypothetical protein AXG93_2924s1000 [Marchantia polymorpha subsp. ruderalis]
MHRRFGVGGKSAFGPRNAPSGLEIVWRFRRQRNSADTATIATEKGSASPEKDGSARTSAGAVDHATPPADERRPSGQGPAGQGPPELPRAMRTSVPPTHRRLPADRRPLADVDLCLRVGRESSPTHRRPPTSRQDSPPVQRRKGKEPAEDPPSGQGPSGQGPPAYNAPRFAPSAPGPSGQRVTSSQRAEAAPSAGNPPEDAPTRRPDASLAQDRSRKQDLTEERIVCPRDEIRVRDAQLHPAQTHSARSPSAADAGGEEATIDPRQADDGNVARPHSPTALDILAGSSEAAGAPSAALSADHSQPHSGLSPTQSMATEMLPSDDDKEGSTEAVSGSGDTEEEEEEIVGAPAAALSGLLSGDSRSRRKVAKKLEAFLSKAQDTMSALEGEVSAALQRLGLRSRAEEWQGRELVRGSRPRRRRSTGSGHDMI